MSNNVNQQPDFSQAPEGATHWEPVSGSWFKADQSKRAWMFFNDESEKWYIGTYFDDEDSGSELIPRPANHQETPDYSWDGEGMPPVGVIAEFHSFFGIAQFRDGTECRVVSAVTDGDVTVVTASFGPHGYHAFVGECFRPLRTEREKFIERCKGLVIEPHKSEMHICAAAIFDDGARFPEDSK